MDERWITLLEHWQNHKFRHSLTFPFIIGALRHPVGSKNVSDMSSHDELRKLIDVMRSHVADGYYYNIYRCPDLGQLVVRKVVNSNPPHIAIAIHPIDSSVNPSLFVSDGLEKGCTSPFDSIVEVIWNEAGSAIESGNFSCHGKTFGEFSEYDLKVISNALA
jgi:hypothetical protein